MSAPLPVGAFEVIYADPPWTFRTWSAKGKGRSPEQHYNCMSLTDVRALPVPDIAAENCTLFLWATDPLLPEAFKLIEAWGFTSDQYAFDEFWSSGWFSEAEDGVWARRVKL